MAGRKDRQRASDPRGVPNSAGSPSAKRATPAPPKMKMGSSTTLISSPRMVMREEMTGFPAAISRWFPGMAMAAVTHPRNQMAMYPSSWRRVSPCAPSMA